MIAEEIDLQATLAKYGARIARGEVSPHVRWDGRPGIILDASADDVPLELLCFGAWRLGNEAVARQGTASTSSCWSAARCICEWTD
jgi:hypothetical protein